MLLCGNAIYKPTDNAASEMTYTVSSGALNSTPTTHTDQYLNLMSHHPIDHKISVVRTLLERSRNLVSEPEEKKKEDIHVQDALRTCGYPEWSLQKARRQMKQMKPKKRKQDVAVSRPSVVIPYVEKVSETVARIMTVSYTHLTLPTILRV